jgi:RNA polymerase sigma-70 factor (ECF subfamily)
MVDRVTESWDLVRAAQGGSPDAFGELYARYYDGVYHYVLGRIGRVALAEDLCSETFLRALRRIGTIRYLGKDPSSWLITIARNVVIDFYKSAANRCEVITDDWTVCTTYVDSAEQVALSRMGHRRLRGALRRLTPDQRSCLQFRFYRGLSVPETAKAMSLNAVAVRALQYRALRKLAEVMPAYPESSSPSRGETTGACPTTVAERELAS